MYPMTNFPSPGPANVYPRHTPMMYSLERHRIPMTTPSSRTPIASLPSKKRILMRSHMAIKQHREQQQKRVQLHRQQSDASAILTAARALLSLSPEDAVRDTKTQPPTTPKTVMTMTTTRSTGIPAVVNSIPSTLCYASDVSDEEEVYNSNHDEVYRNSHHTKTTVSHSEASSFCSASTFHHDSLISPPPPQLVNHRQNYYTGSVSLALDSDEEALSPLHCFMRRYCVEAFTATSQEVATPRYGKSNGRRITVGQVGIRCLHCKHRAEKQERAVCFPSSLKNIYHSIETWQRRHSLVCQDIPDWIKERLAKLMESSRSGAGGRRQYWEESAKRLGIVDTNEGLRFIRQPGHELPTSVLLPSLQHVEPPQNSHVPVVTAADQELVTGYLFVLLDQMEACQFTEQDRTGGRSKVKNCPVGYPGLQCKHCGGKAGFGRYFPATLQALTSANSDRNIYNHIRKCRKCPDQVRNELERLGKEQTEHQFKNRRGSRKLFFRRVWQRLHGSENIVPSS